MDGTLDRRDFELAYRLRVPLSDVRAMPNVEFVQWLAWFKYQGEMEKLHG